MAWVLDFVCCHSNSVHDGYSTIKFNIDVGAVYRIIKAFDKDNRILEKRNFFSYEYEIFDNSGEICRVPASIFHDITKEEMRDYQINEILK